VRTLLTRTLDDLETERRRYDMLVDRMIAMKREGFMEPPAPPEPTQELPGLVQRALADRMEPGTTDYARSLEIAQRMLDEGIPSEDVASQILEGEEVEFL